MKKTVILLLALGLLAGLGNAQAEAAYAHDAVPQAVQEMVAQENADATASDCILFTDVPTGPVCLLLTDWGMNGYQLQDGVWTRYAQVSPIQQEANARQHLIRHNAGSAPGLQGACGLTYPDGLGFDLLKVDINFPSHVLVRLQYHWEGEGFRLLGWQADDAGQCALWEDGVWAYFDSVTGKRLGSARIDRIVDYGLLMDEAYLPMTLAAAQKMEAITQATVETLYPGWTLASYEEFNMGHSADAGYYRLADGKLAIRRVSLSSELGVESQTQTMPVPLTAALYQRLQKEGAKELLDTSGYGDTFCTDDALDRTQIPVEGKVLQNDLQTHGLMLLTEDADGTRRLQWLEQTRDGYASRTSQPLPKDTSLDLFHSGEDAIGLEWNAQRSQCSFTRSADGNWHLGWVTQAGATDSLYGTLYCGIQRYLNLSSPQGILVGSHPWRDLFSLDVTQLPTTVEEAAAGLNRDGWAVVQNPDPADRLHLRLLPDEGSLSLGKFYNRTPVQVVEQKGEWSLVRIGLDGRLEGWMKSAYLRVGSAMDSVDSASPELILREAYKTHAMFATEAMLATTDVQVGRDTWIVGVVEDQLYILLDAEGNTGFLPQSWFWAGNG